MADSEFSSGGPIEEFLRVTEKSPADMRTKLREWNEAAMRLFLADLAHQEKQEVPPPRMPEPEEQFPDRSLS